MTGENGQLLNVLVTGEAVIIVDGTPGYIWGR